MKKYVLAAAIAAAALGSSALAQTRSSFQDADLIGGVQVQLITGLTYKVSLSNHPQLKIGATYYNITDVFGFWALSDDIDLSGSTSSFGVWSDWNKNSGTGGIVGWKTNPNTGITPGGSQNFTFDSLAVGDVDHFGFHIRVDGTLPNGGNTAYFTDVPAPGAATLAGLGLVVAARRRRR
ncbi:MAG: hypothetical protein HUU19_09765 [Phycisphaerales bacterium]|mgnify:CR=1 FL=1|nr:hypothetical protein [Phycisphaerales bacterium]